MPGDDVTPVPDNTDTSPKDSFICMMEELIIWFSSFKAKRIGKRRVNHGDLANDDPSLCRVEKARERQSMDLNYLNGMKSFLNIPFF
jgi:hypothetical protein